MSGTLWRAVGRLVWTRAHRRCHVHHVGHDGSGGGRVDADGARPGPVEILSGDVGHPHALVADFALLPRESLVDRPRVVVNHECLTDAGIQFAHRRGEIDGLPVLLDVERDGRALAIAVGVGLVSVELPPQGPVGNGTTADQG